MPPNIGAANYIRKLLIKIKSHIDMNALIEGDLNMPLSEIDRSSKQKINKETRSLYDILDQMDLIDIYRTFTLKQQNNHSSQVHMEPTQEQTTYWVTNQDSSDTKRLRLFPAYSQITML